MMRRLLYSTLVITACSSPAATPPADMAVAIVNDLAVPDLAPSCTVMLAPAASADDTHTLIQTAIANATSGAVLCFAGGTYPLHAEVDVAVDGLELRGLAGATAIFDFNGQTTGANGINVTANQFKMTNLTVKNTAGDAVRITMAKGVTLTNVTVTWDRGANTNNGAYGLYPVQCSHVLIDHCSVSYAADAGIYVGQSNTILVRDSEAFGNVAGIEMENSTDSEITGCNAHDNTAGILAFNLPGLAVGDGKRANLHGNKVTNNNGMNFANPAGIVSMVPSGTGMLVMASDNNEVHDNDVTGNQSLGIGVVSYLILMKPYTDMTYDPYPESNWIHGNRLSGNGSMPHDLAAGIAALAGTMVIPPLVWDGFVDAKKNNMDGHLTNCFGDNGSAGFIDLGLDSNFTPHVSMDVTPFNCMRTPLPSIMP